METGWGILGAVLGIVALIRVASVQREQRQLREQAQAEAQALRAQVASLQARLQRLENEPAAAPVVAPTPTPEAAPPAAVSLHKGNVPLNKSELFGRSAAQAGTLSRAVAPLAEVLPSPPVSLSPSSVPRPALPPGTLFALGGAALVLVGMAFVLSQLARAGLLTPQMQWGLAMLLALALYALAGRARPVVAEALRGLGYGIAALCLGALSMRGVLAPAPVLGLVLLLSLLVGLHARARGGLLLVGVAVVGATLSAWLLADNLGLVSAQVALLAVLLSLLLCLHSLREQRLTFNPLYLLPLLPLGLLGLLVTAAAHGGLAASSGPLWVLYGLLLAGGASWLSRPNASQTVRTKATTALTQLLTALLLTGTLTALVWLPLSGSQAPEWPQVLFSPRALWLPGLALAYLALTAERIGKRLVGQPLPADPMREALLSSGLSALVAWLALDIPAGQSLSLRLLPLLLMLALYGQWTAQRGWRVVGAVGAALLLLNAAPSLATGLLLLSALGVALRLDGRAGLVLAVSVAVPLLRLLVQSFPFTGDGGLLLLSLLVGAVGALLALSGRLLPKVNTAPLQALAVTLALLWLPDLLMCLASVRFSSENTMPAWALLAFSLSAALLPAALHTIQLSPLLRAARVKWSPAAMQRAAEWGGLLAWLLGLQIIDLPLWASSVLLLGAALLLSVLRLAQRWPAPVAVLLLALLWLTAGPVLTLAQPAQGLLAWLCAVTVLGALFSQRGRAQWPAAVRQAGAALDTWSAAHQAWVPALWGVLVAALGMAAFVLLAALSGLGGVLRPHALSATLGLGLPALVMLWLARRDNLPPLWTVGLGAFGLAACKLILLDLDELGLTARGLGLTAVGLLLLAIGQLAPKVEGTTKK